MATPYEKFSPKAQDIVFNRAQNEAKSLGHALVGSEHLLLAILSDGDNNAAKALKALSVEYEPTKELITDLLGQKEKINITARLEYSGRVKNICDFALIEANLLSYSVIYPEHLLLGILRENNSVASKILNSSGVSFDYARAMIVNVLKNNRQGGEARTDGDIHPLNGIRNSANVKNQKQARPSGVLAKYSSDLTLQAKSGDLDPVIGREREIERVVQILSRRTKNNPCLIGEPGVGKTAVVEGLAEKIISGDVPDNIKNKRVVSLDISSMIAGTKYRGEFEERLTQAINEIKSNKNIILFIDELHNIVGAGAAEGAIDAANILKPSLARGELQAVGATTTEEYRRYIEKDAALERRFQPVTVEEPSKEETVEILKGLRIKYEQHHGLKISDEALKAAAELSAVYLPERFLPDKAIDLIDEASSKVRMHSSSKSGELQQLEARLEASIEEKKTAVNDQNYEQAALLRDEQDDIRQRIAIQRGLSERSENNNGIVVGENDIAEVLSEWTHIPVTKLTEDESEKLLRLEAELSKRVVGQTEAIKAVSRAIRRSRVGLKNPQKPIGTFIFLGPTGVGKTELSKALAEAVFGTEEAIIRVDMSEYMEKHTVAKLIGSPPGYVGYDEGGQLTEKIRRKPYSVILFDELEKAHPDVINILLQLLDDGRLTDAHGKTVDFKNTLIIMTSNLGADKLKKQSVMGFSAADGDELEYNAMKNAITDELKRTFKPEFVNRLDEVIVFRKLTDDDIAEIIDIMLARFAARLIPLNISMEFDESFKQYIAEKGTDLEFGARPLNRTIQRELEDNMSEEMLKGNIKPGEQVKVTADAGRVIFTVLADDGILTK